MTLRTEPYGLFYRGLGRSAQRAALLLGTQQKVLRVWAQLVLLFRRGVACLGGGASGRRGRGLMGYGHPAPLFSILVS